MTRRVLGASFWERWQHPLLIAGVLLLTLIVYWQSLGNQFVSWNDPGLVGSAIVQHPSLDAVKQAFTRYDPELYIPLTYLSYQLDYVIGGTAPFIYHLDNLILHEINILLVIWFVLLLSESWWVAIITGALFAVHPMNTEAVVWASARKDLLSTLFFLSSVITYMYFRENGKKTLYIASIALFALALLSKVMVISLPIVLLLIDAAQGRRFDKACWIEKIPYGLFMIVFAVIAWFGKSQAVLASTASEKFLISCKSLIFYMEKLVVPYHLSVLYPYNTAISATSPDILISILGVVLVAVFVVWGWKMQRKLIFGLLFFIATIGLTLLNFYRNQDISFAADHYAYLPSIGFLYFLVLGAWMICTSIGRGMTLRFVTIAGGLVILLFALLAHNQSSIWHDSEELFTNALKYYPDTLSARMNLITLYLDSGKPDAAMQQAKELLLLQERGRTHRLIGDIYLDEHKYAEAEQEYKTAVSMEPNSPEHYIRLGDLYAIQGRLKEAEQQYLHVLALDPKQIDVYDNLASVYLAETRYEDAEDTARKMLAEQPLSDRGHYILGISLERQHKIVDAISEFEQTVTLNPMNADAFASLAADYLYMGRNDLALSMLKKAYTLDPSNSAVQGLAHSIVQMGIVRFGTGTGQTQ